MTSYDMLIDTINQKLYEVFTMGRTLDESDWDDDSAKEISHHILEIVEEYQSLKGDKNNYAQWRASD